MNNYINHELDKIWDLLPNEDKLPVNRNDPKFHLEVCRMIRRYFIKQTKQNIESQSSISATNSLSQSVSQSQIPEKINKLLGEVYSQYKNQYTNLSEEQLNVKILQQLQQLRDGKSLMVSQVQEIQQQERSAPLQDDQGRLMQMRNELTEIRMRLLSLRQRTKRDNVTLSYLMIQTVKHCSQSITGLSRLFASTHIEYPDRSLPPPPTSTSNIDSAPSNPPASSNTSPKRPLSTSQIQQKEVLKLSDIQVPEAPNSTGVNIKRPVSVAGKKGLIQNVDITGKPLTQSRIDSQQQKKIQKAIIDEQNQQIKDLINEYNAQQEEIEVLSQQVQDVGRLNMRVNNQQRKIDDLSKNLQEKSTECIELQKKLEVAKKQQNLLKNQVNKMLENKSGAADVIAENSRLNQQNQEIQGKYNDMCEENNKIYVIMEENEKTIATQEQELEELRKYIKQCEENLREQKEELDNYIKQLAKSQDKEIKDSQVGFKAKIKKLLQSKYIITLCATIIFLITSVTISQLRHSSCKKQLKNMSKELNSSNKLLDEAINKEQLITMQCNQTIEQNELKQQVNNQQYESKIKSQWAMIGGSSVLSAVLFVVMLVKK